MQSDSEIQILAIIPNQYPAHRPPNVSHVNYGELERTIEPRVMWVPSVVHLVSIGPVIYTTIYIVIWPAAASVTHCHSINWWRHRRCNFPAATFHWIFTCQRANAFHMICRAPDHKLISWKQKFLAGQITFIVLIKWENKTGQGKRDEQRRHILCMHALICGISLPEGEGVQGGDAVGEENFHLPNGNNKQFHLAVTHNNNNEH